MFGPTLFADTTMSVLYDTAMYYMHCEAEDAVGWRRLNVFFRQGGLLHQEKVRYIYNNHINISRETGIEYVQNK